MIQEPGRLIEENFPGPFSQFPLHEKEEGVSFVPFGIPRLEDSLRNERIHR
jgi:hypothetical protein